MDSEAVTAIVDKISIAEMKERYGLSSKQAVYDRLKRLNIKPVKGAIDRETELPKMDQLHEEIQSPKTVLSSLSTGQIQKSSGQLDRTAQPEMMMALFELLAGRAASPGPGAIASLKERLELLELCAQQGNTLSTSELAAVLDIKPDSLREHGQYFKYGYLFLKSGKHGHELAWSVQRHIKKSTK